MTEKERILAFDRELISMNEEKTVACRIMYILMSVLGCFMAVFPVGAEAMENGKVIFIFCWLFLDMAVLFRIQPYIYVFDGSVRVRTLLEYVPVDKCFLRQVRRGYLRRYLLKIGVVIFLLQQFGALMESWSVWNLVYPAVLICFLYLEGLLFIGRG